jgi:hypothetical protein
MFPIRLFGLRVGYLLLTLLWTRDGIIIGHSSLLGMCYIIFNIGPHVLYTNMGSTGGGEIFGIFCVNVLVVLRHMVFVYGFLLLVKELGLLTNMSQWIRVLDTAGSYIYYCKQ